MPVPTYPTPPRVDLTEDHFGQPVADPFRPLENPADPATAAWVAAERDLTDTFLGGLPAREAIRSRLTELWNYPRVGVPFERGGVWFQFRNSGLQPQSVLYTGRQLDAIDRVLIDPNILSADGTASLTRVSVHEDGSVVAFAVSDAGSDWLTWRVRDVATGADSSDEVRWAKYSGAAWMPDRSGFFYGTVARPEVGAELVETAKAPRVMFHALSTASDEDTEVFACPDGTDWIPRATVSDDGKTLVVTVYRGTAVETHVLARPLKDPTAGFAPLTEPFAAKVEVVTSEGDSFVVLTDLDAEKGRVMRAELGRPSSEWIELIPESGDKLLEAHVYGGHLVCHYLDDAHSVVRVFSLDGQARGEVAVPPMSALEEGPGEGGCVEGRAGSNAIQFKAVSFTRSGEIWSHHLGTGQTTLISGSAANFDATPYVTERMLATSADGTPVPMFVTHRRDAGPDGQTPVLLYGYGGFDIPITPSFSVMFAVWLESGGALAVANLRGGGEFGRKWYDGGRLARKQNVFDDYCACARWFVDSGWSRPDRIAISGGSNGGLLVGACLTQHPEMFGAAIADVGVFDMLRFHKWTIGWAWKSDFGDPDEPDGFGWVRAYSPLHNVRPGTSYPATLILTGDHDDRVVPYHSFKFAAALQEAQGASAPVLLRVETSAGHGLGKPTDKVIGEATDRLAFLGAALSLSGN